MTGKYGELLYKIFLATDAVMGHAASHRHKAGSPRMSEDGEGRREVLASPKREAAILPENPNEPSSSGTLPCCRGVAA